MLYNNAITPSSRRRGGPVHNQRSSSFYLLHCSSLFSSHLKSHRVLIPRSMWIHVVCLFLWIAILCGLASDVQSTGLKVFLYTLDFVSCVINLFFYVVLYILPQSSTSLCQPVLCSSICPSNTCEYLSPDTQYLSFAHLSNHLSLVCI